MMTVVGVLGAGLALGVAGFFGAALLLALLFRFRQRRLGARPPRGAPEPSPLSAALAADLSRRRAVRDDPSE